MGWGNPILLLLGVLALLLVSAGIEDLRRREIANWKNIAIAVLAPVWWWANGLQPWPDMALQIASALIVFGLFCIAFARGWMGGGDVKMIGALALWCIAVGALAWLLIVMSLVGGLLTIVLMIDRKRLPSDAEIEVPYGVAIAVAAFFAIHQPILNQLR
ncbi:A24 family peptidase [Sphingomonas sp. PB4P5]|uniref:A24 family peptidase n=1 Tax=Parasphingomonas puruogangriensis TaxID=3096155 RepID=UPI002FC75BB2